MPLNPRRSCGTHNNTPCTSDVSSGIFIFYALSIHFKRLESIVKLCFRRGLTTRSTGHFAACQVWAKIRAHTRHAAKCRLTFTLGCTYHRLLTTASAKSKTKGLLDESFYKCWFQQSKLFLLTLTSTVNPVSSMSSPWSGDTLRSVRKIAICIRSSFGQRNVCSTGIEARGCLALRASVLRRAVSQSARPAEQRAPARLARAA